MDLAQRRTRWIGRGMLVALAACGPAPGDSSDPTEPPPRADVLVHGFLGSPAALDTDANHVFVAANEGDFYGVMTAFDLEGEIVWKRETRRYVGTVGIDLTPSGDVLWAGSGESDGMTIPQVILFSDSGEELWRRASIADAMDEFFHSVSMFPEDDLFAVAAGDELIGVDRLAPTFDPVWTTGFDDVCGRVNDLVVMPDSDIVVVGGQNSFGSDVPPCNESWVARYAMDGARRWLVQQPPETGDAATAFANARSVAIGSAGEIVVAGFDGSPSDTYISQLLGVAWIERLSEDGRVAWRVSIEDPELAIATEVVADPAGYVVLGWMAEDGAVDEDEPNFDVFTHRYTDDGALVWRHRYGDAHEGDIPVALAIATHGVYVAVRTTRGLEVVRLIEQGDAE